MPSVPDKNGFTVRIDRDLRSALDAQAQSEHRTRTAQTAIYVERGLREDGWTLKQGKWHAPEGVK